ncbi:MAG: hypothetical protein DRO40_10370 [Thermoprotei archaeon]|nr:MAG: hypothetical protein DRO40_10370 [Thermoprotei archaeon]
MRIGIASWSYHRGILSGRMSIEDFIKRAFELNVDGVELNQRFLKLNKDYIRKIKRLVLSYGLDISCLTIANNFCLPRKEEREKQVDFVKKWADAALILNAPIIRVNAGWPRRLREEEAFNYAVECIKEVCNYTEDYGLVVAVENHGGITSTAEQVLKIIKAVNSEWFKVNLDVGNFRENLYRNIELLAPYTVHVHAKTFQLKLKHEDTESYWVETRLDYRKIIEILKNAGYNGYLSLEYEGTEDEETAVPKSIQFLRYIIKQI